MSNSHDQESVPKTVLAALREFVANSVGIFLAKDALDQLQQMGVDAHFDSKAPYLCLGNKVKVRTFTAHDDDAIPGNGDDDQQQHLVDMTDLIPGLFCYCFGREPGLKQKDPMDRWTEMLEAFDKEALAMLGRSIHFHN